MATLAWLDAVSDVVDRRRCGEVCSGGGAAWKGSAQSKVETCACAVELRSAEKVPRRGRVGKL